MNVKNSLVGMRFRSVKYGDPMGKYYVVERVVYIPDDEKKHSPYDCFLIAKNGERFKLGEVGFG